MRYRRRGKRMFRKRFLRRRGRGRFRSRRVRGLRIGHRM